MSRKQLLVGGFGGIYFGKPLKNNPMVMSSVRDIIPEDEFLKAIENYTKAKLERNSDTLEVKTEGGKLIFSITVYK